MKRIFFDNAATTPMAPEVIELISQTMASTFGNPSSIHAEGRQARAAIERARMSIAKGIGASIGEIFFTSGGTESNNMTLKCAVRDLGVKRIISSPIEHHCILHSLDTLLATTDVEVELLPVNQHGQINPEDLRAALAKSDAKTLVSLMHSNNEVGSMIDLDEISAICEEAGAFFHSDTVQTMGFFPIDVSKTKIHFLSGSAHKFHGPKGIGFIYVNADNTIKPYIDGGSQERNMRGGTENLYGIVGMAKAFQLMLEQQDHFRAMVTELKEYLRTELRNRFTGLHFNSPEEGHYKVLSVAFPPAERSELLLLNLDIAGICVSGGSACSSGAEAGSHVIEAIGGDITYKTIRFSFSHYNTKEEVDYLLKQLEEILPEHRKAVATV